MHLGATMHNFTVCAPRHARRAPCVPHGLAQLALSVAGKASLGLGRHAAPASHAT